MKITSIELAGSIETGKRLPRAFARISRPNGSDHIQIETLAPDRKKCRTHRIPADCQEYLQEIAETLQWILDGRDANSDEIEKYVRVLRLFTD